MRDKLKQYHQIKENEKCKNDPWHWIENYVYTLDPHDKETPRKRFPVHGRYRYLKEITDRWLEEQIVCIPKSRQMLISWLMVTLHLWMALFYPGSLIIIQSKKELDADDLIGRAEFILKHLPEWMQLEYRRTFCQIKFPKTDSVIRGLPQGGEQIRMQVASAVFMDEAAFMEEAEDAYAATRPCIEGGGRLTMVSSANPSFFELVATGRINEA